MEPEGSLSCSQVPVTGPHPEPDESSPQPPTLFDPSIYDHIFQVSSSFQIFQYIHYQ